MKSVKISADTKCRIHGHQELKNLKDESGKWKFTCLVGKTCGLVRGETNAVYIEYTLDHANEEFNGHHVRRFPKKDARDDDFQATIDVCGYLAGMGNICAPFSLPNVNACNQGLDKGVREKVGFCLHKVELFGTCSIRSLLSRFLPWTSYLRLFA